MIEHFSKDTWLLEKTDLTGLTMLTWGVTELIHKLNLTQNVQFKSRLIENLIMNLSRQYQQKKETSNLEN